VPQGNPAKRAAPDGLHPALLAASPVLPVLLQASGGQPDAAPDLPAFNPPGAYPLSVTPLVFPSSHEFNGFGVVDPRPPLGAAAPPPPPAAAEESADAARSGGAAPPAAAIKLLTLDVGGRRFPTTTATLEAAPASYFGKLALKAAASAKAEFFIDRSGEVFHHVLDHLRSLRYGHPPAPLPADPAALQLVAREAAFYRLPELGGRAAAALAAASAGAREDLSAVYLETGFCAAAALPAAHSELLERLNAAVGAKAAAGYAVVKRDCGTEREGGERNLYYHILLARPASL
jgi:hypothetical protein